MTPRLAPCLATLALAACAGGSTAPEVDLTPWTWTWAQTASGARVIRYGFPIESASEAAEPWTGGEISIDGEAMRTGSQAAPAAGASETPFASHRYGCARADRARKHPCQVRLDFWLIRLAPPLAADTLADYRERFESAYAAGAAPDPPVLRESVRDARGREWHQRSFTLPSGASFAHYSRPIDATLALAVTSFVTREPDRLGARDLARGAIERIRILAPGPRQSRGISGSQSAGCCESSVRASQ
jgi:hypothetical protein